MLRDAGWIVGVGYFSSVMGFTLSKVGENSTATLITWHTPFTLGAMLILSFVCGYLANSKED